jgi:hypothetical protein
MDARQPVEGLPADGRPEPKTSMDLAELIERNAALLRRISPRIRFAGLRR